MKLVYLNVGGTISYNRICFIWSDNFDFYFKKDLNAGMYSEDKEHKNIFFKKYML